MNAEAARRFVAGKLFAFTCFEGTTGSGRIFNDGSVAGMRAHAGQRARCASCACRPARCSPKGEAICSHVKGAFFNPCFDLNKTSDKSFRGAVSGFGFAYCDFTHGRGREMIASVGPSPDDKLPMPRSIRRATRSHAHAPAVVGRDSGAERAGRGADHAGHRGAVAVDGADRHARIGLAVTEAVYTSAAFDARGLLKAGRSPDGGAERDARPSSPAGLIAPV